MGIQFRVDTGYIPGSIDRIAELHDTYYHDNWGFGVYSEAKVATWLAAFLRRYDENRAWHRKKTLALFHAALGRGGSGKSRSPCIRAGP